MICLHALNLVIRNPLKDHLDRVREFRDHAASRQELLALLFLCDVEPEVAREIMSEAEPFLRWVEKVEEPALSRAIREAARGASK